MIFVTKHVLYIILTSGSELSHVDLFRRSYRIVLLWFVMFRRPLLGVHTVAFPSPELIIPTWRTPRLIEQSVDWLWCFGEMIHKNHDPF